MLHRQVWLPGDENEFNSHDVHVLVSIAAVNIEYSPALQLVHMDDPGASLYVPGTHATQEPPSGPVYPTLQTHAVDTLLLGGDCEYAGQSAHVSAEVAPSTDEYVPEEQSTHVSALVAPWVVEYVPVSHRMHVLIDVAPTPTEYCPAPQSRHVLASVANV